MIPVHLRLQPGQEALTPVQEGEARRFAEECIRRQFSTEPVDEREAETLLCQAYEVAGLAPPQRMQWVNGPLHCIAALDLLNALGRFRTSGETGASIRDSGADNVMDQVAANVRIDVWNSVGSSVGQRIWNGVAASVMASVRASVWDNVGESIWASGWASCEDSHWPGFEASIRAYEDAPWLAFSHFFNVYLAPNALHALAHFNGLVSGYWLGKEEAILVRRPRVLVRDTEGRLHSETGTCMEYHDGWGLYAWHGVVVPQKMILTPERLARADFLNEANVEVRRVIQERMGSRFVTELGGQVIDSGPHGALYEVRLPEDDPEGVAHYVQVQDASTARQYILRVPPTIQTAAEAVAWSFVLPGEEYQPAQET